MTSPSAVGRTELRDSEKQYRLIAEHLRATWRFGALPESPGAA